MAAYPQADESIQERIHYMCVVLGKVMKISYNYYSIMVLALELNSYLVFKTYFIYIYIYIYIYNYIQV